MTLTLAAAQISSTRGDIEANLATHLQAAKRAAEAAADVLVFPELSITGYEVDLAESLQAAPDDRRFAPLHELGQRHDMLIFAGMPVTAPAGKPYLGALILGGNAPVFYPKIHLHGAENDYFKPGADYSVTPHAGSHVGAAVCADLTHSCHAAGTRAAGADTYAVGALINEAAWAKEQALLEGYARDHDMAVVFSNHASQSGAYVPVGKSSIWAPGGALIAQADGCEEALIIGQRDGDAWRGRVVAL